MEKGSLKVRFKNQEITDIFFVISYDSIW